MRKGKERVFMNILGIVGVLCLAYFILYVVLVDLTNVFTYFWLIAGIGCFLIRAVCGRIAGGQLVIPLVVQRGAVIVFAAFFLLIFVTEVTIIRYGMEKPSENAEYVLVLGAQVKGSVPTYALQKRLDVAYEYLVDNPKAQVILSGGQGPGEDVTEAYAMAVYLQARGIERDRMLLEEKSTNTEENIRFSKELMEHPKDSVVLVTNHFHVYRGVGVAKKQGLTNVEGLGAPTKWYTVPNLYLREAFAVIKYKIWGLV